MVLTRRAHKTISRWLPNEILAEIIQAAAKADQASLCRVSKLFHDLCLPVLYRSVYLGHCDSGVAFCSSLIEHPTRADLVREFKVAPGYCRYTNGRRDWEPSEVVLQSLKIMQHLEHLSLHPQILLANAALLKFTFPRLREISVFTDYPSLQAVPDWTDLLASFLIRHPLLTNLNIKGVPPPSLKSLDIRIPLPHLQGYYGPTSLLSSFEMGGFSLRTANLRWSADDSADLESIVLRLASSTRPDIPFILTSEINCQENCVALVESLSRNMPHTRTLQCKSVYNLALDAETNRRITACISRFTGLAFLAIGYRSSGPVCWRDEQDRMTAEAWGKACPTLVACYFNYYAWRKVDGTWTDYSTNDFLALSELRFT
ncbi:hypothetical protein DFH09DRAFT_1169933, partial [Mycena vulgaris]